MLQYLITFLTGLRILKNTYDYYIEPKKMISESERIHRLQLREASLIEDLRLIQHELFRLQKDIV
jgi:hypothetical protein